MKMLLRIFPLALVAIPVTAVPVTGNLAAQPPGGSQLSPDENLCATCHGEADRFEGETLRLYVSREGLDEDVHWQAGVNCHDCHGGNPGSEEADQAHATGIGFRSLAEVKKSCANCHLDRLVDLRKGVHAKEGETDQRGRKTPLECHKCHSEDPHQMFPVDDSRSAVFAENQVRTCGGCHEEDLKTYKRSTHGRGLLLSGLFITAVCADCHGAHAICWAEDERSTLHHANVAHTCGKCHRYIEERLEKSVHGRGSGRQVAADRVAPGGKEWPFPSCTDCHQEHELPHPESTAFRLQIPHRCGRCHLELSSTYALTKHARFTELGYTSAAKCSDCHGAHDILPVSDPKSRLAAGSPRLQTCRKCHLYAVRNFSDFDPHADHHDAQRYPVLHAVYSRMNVLLYSILGVFILHSSLWFVRSLIHTLQYGHPKRAGALQHACVCFEPVHRAIHAIMVVSLLGLALTGLPLKYGDQVWAGDLARALGGFESTRILHRICAVATSIYFATHFVWMIIKVCELRMQDVRWRTVLFGSDSPMPNVRDVVDLSRMVRWFFGMGPKPVFERWTYWEKFECWAVFWGVSIIGICGLMRWFPGLFCRVLPGEALNVAQMIHSEGALPAAGIIFVIHFFHAQIRPEKFPMDLSVLTGLVNEDDLRRERPEYLARMRREGKLSQICSKPASRKAIWLRTLGGFLAFGVWLCLLAKMILVSLGE